MPDNDLTLTLTAKVQAALDGLDKVGSKIDKLTEKQHKLKESSGDFGAKTVAAFEAVKVGAEKALEFAERVARAIGDIDNNLANLSRRGGASNVALTQSLTSLGASGEDRNTAQRIIRGQQGSLNQQQLDTFVASLGETAGPIGGKRTAQLAGVAARGNEVIGNLGALGPLQHLFGDKLSAADIGDLAVQYAKAVPGGFTQEAEKGVHELIGAGLDPFQALAVSANFNKVGEKRGVSALASFLNGGGTLEQGLSGATGEAVLDRSAKALTGSGRGLGSINADTATFSGVTKTDVIGNELAHLPEATAREKELRTEARGIEINRNNESDRGVGAQARTEREQVEDAIASLEANGDWAQATQLKLQLEKYGPAYAAKQLNGTGVVGTAASVAASIINPWAQRAGESLFRPGPEKPTRVVIHNQAPTAGN